MLGALYELAPDDTADFFPIDDVIEQTNEVEQVTSLLSEMRPKDYVPTDVSGFYSYSGSLTTPGCDEIVNWTVFTSKLSISQNQIDKFKHLQTAHGGEMHYNYRHIQGLHGRVPLLKVSPIKETIKSKKEYFNKFFPHLFPKRFYTDKRI